jgi:hypothetical protein
VSERAGSYSSASLISETEVLVRWPALSKAGLKAARENGKISWVRGKRGSAWYRPSAIEHFINQELEQPCRDHARAPSLNLPGNGLPTIPVASGSIASGVTRAMEEHVALVYEQATLKPRNSAIMFRQKVSGRPVRLGPHQLWDRCDAEAEPLQAELWAPHRSGAMLLAALAWVSR